MSSRQNDPDRLLRITALIREFWEKYPDMRLGQLLYAALHLGKERLPTDDLYFLDDETLERSLNICLSNTTEGPTRRLKKGVK